MPGPSLITTSPQHSTTTPTEHAKSIVKNEYINPWRSGTPALSALAQCPAVAHKRLEKKLLTVWLATILSNQLLEWNKI